MGTDFSIRPVGAPVSTTIARPAPPAVREAVPAQLPPDRTVNAPDAALRSKISASNYQQADSDRITRGVMIDKDAASIVYVSVDKKTNQVINQYPEESRLRTRAYLRAMDSAKLDRRIETDRSA